MLETGLFLPIPRWAVSIDEDNQPYEQQIWMLSDALGADLAEVRIEQQIAVAPESRDVLAGHLKAGTVSGQRYRWPGRRNGKTLIEIEALWTLGGFYPKDWPKLRDGWTVSIESDPSFQTRLMSLARLERRDVTLHDHIQAAIVAAAVQAVNAISALCLAATGWRSIWGWCRLASGFDTVRLVLEAWGGTLACPPRFVPSCLRRGSWPRQVHLCPRESLTLLSLLPFGAPPVANAKVSTHHKACSHFILLPRRIALGPLMDRVPMI